jgi:hypothetical protein
MMSVKQNIQNGTCFNRNANRTLFVKGLASPKSAFAYSIARDANVQS